MKILISGSTGLIGSHLVSNLIIDGHYVHRLVRNSTELRESDIYWDPVRSVIDAKSLEEFDAVIHLAGENISDAPWTKSKKEKILESRLQGTKFLSKTLSELKKPPAVFITASAIGFYGDRGEEILTEDSPAGSTFLATVCEAWENATWPVKERNIRLVHTRFGIVLTSQGGALPRMRRPFKMGLGGRLGNGQQYMSWVSLTDVVSAIKFCLDQKSLEGPINLVSPHPVTNLQFTRQLALSLNRPAVIPVPKYLLKFIFGDMAEALLLSSARVIPKKLLEAGYQFQHAELGQVLSSELLNS